MGDILMSSNSYSSGLFLKMIYIETNEYTALEKSCRSSDFFPPAPNACWCFRFSSGRIVTLIKRQCL